jgi:hypothetical protein
MQHFATVEIPELVVSAVFILSIAVCVQALRECIHYIFVISTWLRWWPSQQ